MRPRAKRRERIKGGGQRMISSSRTSHRASTKACTDVSLFCISNNKKLFKVFRGANRKDVINLTTPTTKKRTKSRHCTCFLPPAKCKERISKSHNTKKRSRNKIERRIFLLSRILGRDFASSSPRQLSKRRDFSSRRD